MVTIMSMKDLLSTGELVNCCIDIAAGKTPDVAHDSIGEFLWELALKLRLDTKGTECSEALEHGVLSMIQKFISPHAYARARFDGAPQCWHEGIQLTSAGGDAMRQDSQNIKPPMFPGDHSTRYHEVDPRFIAGQTLLCESWDKIASWHMECNRLDNESAHEFFGLVDNALSVLFELCRFAEGIKAVTLELISSVVCTRGVPEGQYNHFGFLACLERITSAVDMSPVCPSQCPGVASADGPIWSPLYYQIHQALVDVLGRLIVGLENIEPPEGKVLPQGTILNHPTGAANHIECRKGIGMLLLASELGPQGLLNKLSNASVTDFTNLAESSQRLSNLITLAASGIEFNTVWQAAYNMEHVRSLEHMLAGVLKEMKIRDSSSEDSHISYEPSTSIPDVETPIDSTPSNLQEFCHDKKQECQSCFVVKHDGSMMRCSRCKTAIFCSKECQRSAWKGHRQKCRSVADQTRAWKGHRQKCRKVQSTQVDPLADLSKEYNELETAAKAAKPELDRHMAELQLEARIEDTEKRVASGDAIAQYDLACLYHEGDGLEQDFQRAFELFQLSAAQGFRSAQHNLANAFKFGRGVSADPASAVKWWEAAAAQGHVGSFVRVYEAFLLGDGVPKDEERAAQMMMDDRFHRAMEMEKEYQNGKPNKVSDESKLLYQSKGSV